MVSALNVSTQIIPSSNYNFTVPFYDSITPSFGNLIKNQLDFQSLQKSPANFSELGKNFSLCNLTKDIFNVSNRVEAKIGTGIFASSYLKNGTDLVHSPSLTNTFMANESPPLNEPIGAVESQRAVKFKGTFNRSELDKKVSWGLYVKNFFSNLYVSADSYNGTFDENGVMIEGEIVFSNKSRFKGSFDKNGVLVKGTKFLYDSELELSVKEGEFCPSICGSSYLKKGTQIDYLVSGEKKMEIYRLEGEFAPRWLPAIMQCFIRDTSSFLTKGTLKGSTTLKGDFKSFRYTKFPYLRTKFPYLFEEMYFMPQGKRMLTNGNVEIGEFILNNYVHILKNGVTIDQKGRIETVMPKK